MTNKQRLVNELIDNGAFLEEAENNLLQMSETLLEKMCVDGFKNALAKHHLSKDFVANVDMSKRVGSSANTWKDAANDVAVRAVKGVLAST